MKQLKLELVNHLWKFYDYELSEQEKLQDNWYKVRLSYTPMNPIYNGAVGQDDIITFKKISNPTKSMLYWEKIVPFELNIMIKGTYDGEKSKNLKAKLYDLHYYPFSKDDSDYSIWFNGLTYKKALKLREKLVEIIDSMDDIDEDIIEKKFVELGGITGY